MGGVVFKSTHNRTKDTKPHAGHATICQLPVPNTRRPSCKLSSPCVGRVKQMLKNHCREDVEAIHGARARGHPLSTMERHQGPRL